MSAAENDRRQRAPRWMRITLILSLALNLAVAGLVGGAVWRHGGLDGMRQPPRSLIGAMLHELPRDDRRAMREHARSRSERRVPHAEITAEMAQALRAVPFRPEPLAALITDHARRRAAFESDALAVWLDRVAAMSDRERAAYADRLQEAVKHRHRRKRD